MEFGVGISTCREGLFYPVGFTSVEGLVKVAVKSEELGYAAVWGNDHITTQNYIKQKGGKPNFYEPLVVFSHLSALTKKIVVGTAVVIGPIRNPVVLAKQAITLDHLSKGRFVLGVGLGAYREEFEAINMKGNRGQMLDEFMECLTLLFNQTPASFQGKYYSFTDIEMLPRPLTSPFPLYVGGNSPEVLRRVGVYGTGWLPAALTPDQAREGLRKIREYAKLRGRQSIGFKVALEAGCYVSNDESEARRRFVGSPFFQHLVSLKRSTLKDLPSTSEEELFKRNFVGTPDVVISKIQEFEDAGVDQVWFDFIADDEEELLRQMEFFAGEVMPSFR